MTKDEEENHKDTRIVDDNFFLNQQTSTNKQNPRKNISSQKKNVLVKKAHEHREKLSLLQQHTHCAPTNWLQSLQQLMPQ
jgi:hypothetical protein